ncbi:cyclin [Salvia divinorum]|uniref:Cyclin n=1 Tax=Salvia divinorum TaxID=28513 RepID=A0ABD1HNB4_SALDI
MAVDHNNAPKSSLPHTLHCEEQQEEESKSEITSNDNNNHPLLPFEYDLRWDEDELRSLLRRDRESQTPLIKPAARLIPSPSARTQAVEFVLAISSHHGFSASAAVLAVNFVDRFLSSFDGDERPWLLQLAAVACLSLAAKVEETHVPLLVDLQVEDAKYLFEAKTIMRMELLILSSLDWRMNPVTPLSFIDHFVRRLGFEKGFAIRLQFLTCCENTIISFISDSRWVGYSAGVVASATMLHVVHQVEYCFYAVECEKMVFEVLGISKMEVEKCCTLISDVHSNKKKKLSTRRNCESSGSRCSWNDATIVDGEVANDDGDDDESCHCHPILKKHKH